MTWSNGVSFIALTASGIVSATLAGDPPPSSIHLTPGTGESGMAVTSSIHKEAAGGFAPHTIILRADATGATISPGSETGFDIHAHDITWRHLITRDGDPGWSLSAFSAPEHLPEFWNRRGDYAGKRIVAVLDQPGTYRHIVTAIDPTGRRATSTVRTIEVADPDALFTAAQTYLVSPSSTWDGPSHDVGNRYTTLQAAWDAARAAGHTRFRILTRRGETVAGFGMNAATSTRQFLFDAYGSGASPSITSGCTIRNLGAGNGAHFAFRNWRMTGGLDTAAGTGSSPDPHMFISPEDDFIVSYTDCFFENVDSALYAIDGTGFNWSTVAPTSGFVVACNTVFDGRFNASMFGESGGGFAMIGCRSTSRPDGRSMLDSNSGGGFGYRTSSSRYLEYVSRSDLFNVHGNFFSTGNVGYTQPNMRFQTSYGSAVAGAHFVVDRCTVESGQITFGFPSDVGNNDPRWTRQPCNYLVDGLFYVKGHTNFSGAIQTNNGGTTVRNVQCAITPNRPDSRALSSPGSFNSPSLFNAVFETNNSNQPAYAGGAGSNPIKSYSNTLLLFTDDTSAAIHSIDSGFSSVFTEANNLVYAPVIGGGNYSGAFQRGKFFTPRYRGFRTYNFLDVVATSVTPTHVVDIGSATGTITQGTTMTAGAVTGRVTQVHSLGGSNRRIWLDNLSPSDGTIGSGVSVSFASGGSGTTSTAMEESLFGASWEPTGNPGSTAGPFARVGMRGSLQTLAFRGAWPQAA